MPGGKILSYSPDIIERFYFCEQQLRSNNETLFFFIELNKELWNICIPEQRTSALQIGKIMGAYSADEALQTLWTLLMLYIPV